MPQPNAKTVPSPAQAFKTEPPGAMFWPVPALLAWVGAWGIFSGLYILGAPVWLCAILATGFGLGAGRRGTTPWRRLCVAGGFPLSFCATQIGSQMPAWVWLVAMVFLILCYPLNIWKDAPLFPTPKGILDGIQTFAPLPRGARILDAGCGLGDGLRELHRIFPEARLIGWEWS